MSGMLDVAEAVAVMRKVNTLLAEKSGKGGGHPLDPPPPGGEDGVRGCGAG
jgi:hypothetical protein